jgi:hypothetical protein
MRSIVISAALVAGWVTIAGCNKPNHQAAVAQREDNLRGMVGTLQSIEGDRPENMRRNVGMIKSIDKRDQEMFHEDQLSLDRAIKQEARFWQDSQPVYRKRIEELMQGDPGSIDRTLPLILY